MAEEIGTISYEVRAETAQAIQSTRQFNKNLSDMESKVGKTDKSIGGLNTSLTKVAGAVAAAIGAQQLMQLQKLSEGFNLLRARVTRLSQDAASATENFNSLLQIANRTGTSVADTVKLWEGLTATLKEFGATSGDVQVLVETLQKIGVVGGSSADEMSNALRQLGQAISGGVLRAEEFNSIIEQMPELGRQIAAGLGIPFSELRQQMLDGELTSQKVLGAIYKQVGTVNAEFAKMPRTVAQAGNAIVNVFGDAVSRVDAEIGASKNIAKFLDLLAKGVEVTFSKELQDRQKFNDLLAERQRLQESINTVERNSPTSTTQLEVMRNRYAAINDELRKMQDAEKKRIQDSSKGEQRNDRPDYLKNIKATGKDKDGQKAANEQERNNRIIEEARLRTQQLDAQYKVLNDTEGKLTSTKLRHTEASARLEAQQKLSSGASNEQIAALAKEIYAQDQMSAKLDARIEKEKKLKELESQKEEAKRFTEQVAFDAASPLEKIDIEEQAKLAKLQEYQSLLLAQDGLSQQEILAQEQQFQTARNQIIEAAAMERQQIETARNSMILGASADFFGGMADLTGAFAGEQSGAYKALFAISKGFAIANAALQLQTAIANASALPWPANLPAIGQAVALGGQIASSISGISYGGGRQFGGPVNPGSMYRVGEGNAPELFSSGGSSYMIPGSRGQVTPMDGASGGVTFNITNNASDMVQTQQSYDPETRTVELAITAIANQINSRTGKVGAAMKSAGAYNRLGG